MPAPVLELAGIVKRYGPTLAVGPVDFTVEEGEFLTLLGPSGCGKTTTLHIVAGLIGPDAGRVIMRGRDVTDLEPRARDMGVVFQNYALFPHRTVFDNIAFGLRMRRVAKAEIAERVRRMLDVVGLPGVEERYPRQLSGGQRQRVAVARALVIHPAVLLLDEPLSNLDALLRKRMRRELRAIQRRVGITAIFVTHDQDEAFEMSDRVILLNRGRIEQIGAPESLYDDPATRFAAEFIGEANVIDATVEAIADGRARLRAGPGLAVEAVAADGALGPGHSVHLVVRPERVHVEPGPSSEPAMIAATVAERVFSGNMVRFVLRTEDGIELRSNKPNLPSYRAIAPGERVAVTLEGCRAVRREEG